MDYEKKYKEIVWQIKKAYLYAQTDSAKAVLEEIFPELKESEDERIRKGLIKAVSRTFEGNKLFGTYVTREEALAWLEKQGEKDRFIKEEIECIKGYRENAIKKLEELEKQGEKPQGKSALEAINEEKVDNQNCVKPADKVGPKFKVGDAIKITGINNGHTGYSILNTEDGYYYKWKLIDKKTAWSEEDELVVKDIEDAITNYWHGYTPGILLDWLKSLKQRIKGE